MSDDDIRPQSRPPAAGAPDPNETGDDQVAAATGIGRLVAWAQQNRARLEIMAIAAIALGGIVCMCLATLVIVWRLGNE